ncbi:MAG: thymidine phosphorylase [Candidatus Micrarchaeia archaeon]|jgi:AMP phosphorylase
MPLACCSNTYTARCFDIEAGLNVAVLNDETAKRLNIEKGDRILISFGKKKVLALADYSDKYVKTNEISLFADVSSKLGDCEGKQICVEKAQRPKSLDYIRKKLDGDTLTETEIGQIIDDLMVEHFSTAELAAFVTSVYIRGLSPDEIVGLTKAMVRSGESMSFAKNSIVASEHSIGGVAGDRVSMLIVPIVASCGVIIPKTASRAISSASGTADAMEVLAPVELTRKQVENVAKKTGGALVWGGGVNIAIADDKLIQVRHPLRLDPSGLLLSSILAKKKAEGAKYVLLDIPVGRGSKINDLKEANSLANSFKMLSSRLGMSLNCIITDGSEPAMNAIGPAIEARAVLEILADGGKSHPQLAEKAIIMSSVILQMAKSMDKDKAYALAKKQLESGAADRKFRQIIAAQGGDPKVKPSQIQMSKEHRAVKAKADGKVGHIDNKAIFRLCRALGAPSDKKAGIMLKVKKEQRICKGDTIFEVYSSSAKSLEYVCSRIDEYPVVEIEKIILDMI